MKIRSRIVCPWADLFVYRMREHIWSIIEQKSGIPWRAAEAMHWHLGEQEISRHARVISKPEEPRGKVVAHQTARNISWPSERTVAHTDRNITLPSIATLFPDISKVQWPTARSTTKNIEQR